MWSVFLLTWLQLIRMLLCVDSRIVKRQWHDLHYICIYLLLCSSAVIPTQLPKECLLYLIRLYLFMKWNVYSVSANELFFSFLFSMTIVCVFFLWNYRAAIYANRHYLAIYKRTHPERLAVNSEGKPRISGDVFIHPTAQVHPTSVVRSSHPSQLCVCVYVFVFCVMCVWCVVFKYVFVWCLWLCSCTYLLYCCRLNEVIVG